MRTMIREAPLGVFLVMVALLLAMAGVAAVAGWHARRQAQLMKNTKTSLISMAEDGYREFEGTVEAVDGQTVVAPLTGSPCCWYAATVEQWKRRMGADRHTWVTVRSVTSSAPFFVRDSTGVCAVRPFGAEVTPTDKSQWTGSTLEPEDRNPPRIGPSQSTHGMLQVSGGPNSQFRYSEERIYAGDPLLVLGMYASHRFDVDFDDMEPEAPIGAVPHTPLAPSTAEDDGAQEDDAAVDTWRAADDERHDTLFEKAQAITKAEIGKGGGGQPLVITTTPQAAHLAMTEKGSQAAFGIALLPLAIAALVIWVRMG